MRRYAVLHTKSSSFFTGQKEDAFCLIRTDDGATWEYHMSIAAKDRADVDSLARVLNADAEEQAVAALRKEVDKGGEP